MDSASFQFVLFGLAVALVSNLSASWKWRSAVLGVSSAIFLILLEPHAAAFFPFVAFLLLGYAGVELLQKRVLRSALPCVALIVLLFVWLKKYTFLPHALFLTSPYFTLGLSYVFFRVLQLLFETANAGERRPVGLPGFLIYTLNFTTLISGPIQSYDDFARDQFSGNPIDLGIPEVGFQLQRIVTGYFKVNVLAWIFDTMQQDALAEIALPISGSARCVAAVRLIIVYPLFLYCNFSGYIDIVIALARLIRVRLPENFNRPFSSTAFIEFWTRWHMSLSNWFKTYLYNPLLVAMMRRISSISLEPMLGVLCFFITFFFVGIWHGRTSEFVFYGFLQGFGVSANKLWQLGLTRALGRKRYKAISTKAWYEIPARGLTFSYFAVTLFWLWANWNQIQAVVASLTVIQWAGVWLNVWIAASVALALWEWLRPTLLALHLGNQSILEHRYTRVVYATTMCFLAFVTQVLLSQAAPAIVYKAF